MNHQLPVIDNCDDCGACCMVTPVPPFQPGEETVLNVPPELMKQVSRRVEADEHFEKIPCVWFNGDTKQCRHYEYRPKACRDFEIGSDLCRLSRWDLEAGH